MYHMYSAAPYGAKELEILHAQFPEVWNNIQHLKFPGRTTPHPDCEHVVRLV